MKVIDLDKVYTKEDLLNLTVEEFLQICKMIYSFELSGYMPHNAEKTRKNMKKLYLKPL